VRRDRDLVRDPRDSRGSGLQYASGSFCGTCYEAMVAALGMPLHHTLSLGVFSGGCALVAGIQSIRFANAARDCGGARAA
jgi:hypothetical protein